MKSPYQKVIPDVAAQFLPFASGWITTGGQPYLTNIIVASGVAPSGTIIVEGSPGNFDSFGIPIGANSNLLYTISTINYSSGVTFSSINQVHPFIRHRVSSITNSVGGGGIATPSGLITTYIFAGGSPDRL